ncbi:hypothetical protein ScPMuIL_008893 [Solemya velum]
MQRARSAFVSPIPQECADVRIEGEWASTWSGERFLLHCDNDWGVAVFATDANLHILQRCRDVYMDGTFRICPSPYKQYFTIHGKYRERVIPLATALSASGLEERNQTFHSGWNQTVAVRHPSLWTFLRHQKDSQANVEVRGDAADRGDPPPHRKRMRCRLNIYRRIF